MSFINGNISHMLSQFIAGEMENILPDSLREGPWKIALSFLWT